jgi:transcriptional regulator with XRE-family HTH domain
MEINIDAFFGHTLRKYRKQEHLSQTILAQKAKLDRTYISMLERGVRKPSLEVVFSIAEALKIDVLHMVGDVKKQVEKCPEKSGSS